MGSLQQTRYARHTEHSPALEGASNSSASGGSAVTAGVQGGWVGGWAQVMHTGAIPLAYRWTERPGFSVPAGALESLRPISDAQPPHHQPSLSRGNTGPQLWDQGVRAHSLPCDFAFTS